MKQYGLGGNGMKRRPAHLRMQHIKGIKERRPVLLSIPVDEILPGETSASERRNADIAPLCASIARHGLLQPVVVRREERTGRFSLVCGERRLAACRLLGSREIDALLISADRYEAAACSLEEHAVRRAPCALDEARMVSRLGARQVQPAYVLADGRVAKLAALLTLTPETLDTAERAGMTMEQMIPLLNVRREDRQLEAAMIIAERQLTPAQARRLVSGPPAGAGFRAAEGKRKAVRASLEEIGAVVKRLRMSGIRAEMTCDGEKGLLNIQISWRAN